jgi:hypothetical protein
MEIALHVNGKTALASDVMPREFSTGSVGLQLPGKVTINGQSYQCNIQLVAVGSKTMDKTAKAAVIASLSAAPVASK